MLTPLLASLALTAAPPPLAVQDLPAPNILVVVLDDVGVDMVGCYGEGPDPAPTPVLNALAAEGVMFRNAWANPVCSPSRAELLTGRYGYRTGLGRIVTVAGWALHLDETTLPEQLRASPTDYRSGAFGKWHLSNDVVGGGIHGPNLQGFQHFVGTAGNIGDPQNYESYQLIENGAVSEVQDYATTRSVDDALEWIHRPDQADQPWFCYVAFHAPHAPYHAPPDGLHTQQAEIAGLDPRIVPRPFYKAMLEAADAELGRLIAGLGEQAQNTRILVVADNGTPAECSLAPFLPEHAKLTPYEGGVNVPLIVSGPGIAFPGREADALVCITDVFATVSEWAGVVPTEAYNPDYLVDSVSLVPYLESIASSPLRDVVYADMFTPNHPSGSGVVLTWRMIRDERYKLIQRVIPPGPPQLFDLQTDPFETYNLIAPPLVSSRHAEVAVTLAQRIATILAGTSDQ